jgi:hypothetical protein
LVRGQADDAQPRKTIAPKRARISPQIVDGSVVFPAPLAPTTNTIAPSPTSSETSSSTGTSPYPE